MSENDWDDLLSGKACPLCAPRPDKTEGMQLIRQLDVSSLYLNCSQTYLGACILIYDSAHATRVDQLSADEWSRFAADLHVAQTAIVKTLAPDHMNTESLGNVVPHLHFHLVPRYQNDGRWRDPIWLTNVVDMPAVTLSGQAFDELLTALRDALGS